MRQYSTAGDLAGERIFKIDTLEANVAYPMITPAAPAAQAWFDKEAPTLGRYLETLS